MKKICIIHFLITLILLLSSCGAIKLRQSITDELFEKAIIYINDSKNKPIYANYIDYNFEEQIFLYENDNCVYLKNSNSENLYSNNYHYTIDEYNQITKETDDSFIINEINKINTDITQISILLKEIEEKTGYRSNGREIVFGDAKGYSIVVKFPSNSADYIYFNIIFTKDKEFMGFDYAIRGKGNALIIYFLPDMVLIDTPKKNYKRQFNISE